MNNYKIIKAITKPWIKLLYPTKIINPENYYKNKDGQIIICNHYATPDTFIIANKFFKTEMNVIAKAEAFKTKLGNKFLCNMGAIPVHRGEPDIKAVKAVMRVLKSNKNFLIFPEGTRNKSGSKELAPFKQGVARFAIKAKKEIVPMMYYRMHKPFRKNWLYVGEPINLEKYYNVKNPEAYKEATELIQSKMNEVRTLLDDYVEGNKIKKLK